MEDDNEDTAALPESDQNDKSQQEEDLAKNVVNTEQIKAEASSDFTTAKTSKAEQKPSKPAIRPRRMVFTKFQA